MYPWRVALSNWSDNANLRIDALGLVTLLGAEEINTSVGRLVSSHYFDALPLCGAYVIAGNRFAEKKPSYALYNISAGIMTTELAGWFSRWIRAQDLRQVRSIVKWTDTKSITQPSRFWVGFVLVGVPLNGMLVALTVVLSDDWWGFANAIAMIISVLVRMVLVSQNRAGIDVNVVNAKKAAEAYMAKGYSKDMAEYEEKLRIYQASDKLDSRQKLGRRPEPPRSPYQSAKVIVIRDDSKVVTLDVPDYLVRIFAVNPQIPHPRLYAAFQWIGWLAFAVHIISIGMASLPAQIYTVLLLGIATILNILKVGCDDSTLSLRLRTLAGSKEQSSKSILVSSRLQASLSEYAEEHCYWVSDGRAEVAKATKVVKVPERRQDLFTWLNLNEEEEELLKAWNLFPREQRWWDVYRSKKEEHRKRVRIEPGKRIEMSVGEVREVV